MKHSHDSFIISNYDGTNKLIFNNARDAYDAYRNGFTYINFEAKCSKDPNLDMTFSTLDAVVKYMQDYEQQQVDLFWDTEIDRYFDRSKPKPVDNNLKTLAALNKPKLSDVPPVALFALGAAMSDGASKYGRFNWRDTGTTASVFYDAMMRHLADWYNGESYANDSKINHLAHIMASCAILLDSELHGNLNDDRDKRKLDSISRNETWKIK